EKLDAANEAVIPTVKKLLDEIQANLFTRAKNFREANTRDAKSYDELKAVIAEKGGFVRAYFGGTPEDEVRIREETGATPRCILPGDHRGKCIITGQDGARLTVFAKAY
ncbi:MAG: proline--tRNA ligase, partial [Synergistaceae bacterium]|nr:proline--tRNA ligase [Synergistaceae bacterium]